MIMDLVEYQARLSRLAQEAKEASAQLVIVPAANKLLATIKNRIAVEGKDSSGGSIGQYSTKAAYFTKEQFVKKSAFRGQGKAGKKKGVTNKSMYIPDGYKGLRDIQGRPTDKMNYDYSGDTLAAYQMEANNKEVLLGLINQRAADIRKHLEQKRGKAFTATSEEIADYDKEVAEEFRLLTLKIFNAA